MNITTRYDWTNTIKKFETNPLKYFEPESLEDIISIVKEAESIQLKVRAVGSGHSYSDVALVDDYMVHPGKLNEVALTNQNILKKNFQDYLNNANGENPMHYAFVDVQAGIRLRELNGVLDKKFGLALTNMGGIDHQTISGVVSTGTHGTGRDLPAFGGMVRSITLVAAGGKVYRVEPSDGITDSAVFREEGITLIQDNDKFNSLLVSFGSMGIIYSLVLEVRPLYWMEEIKSISRWSSIKKMMADGRLFEDIHDPDLGYRKVRGVMVQINPYEIKGDHTVIIVRHLEVNENMKRRLFDKFRNPISELLGNFLGRISYNITIRKLNKHWEKSPKQLEVALHGVKDKRFVNKSYKVLYQGFVYLKERAYDCEFAFDTGQGKLDHINAIDQVFESVKNFAKSNYYESSPLGMRFTKRSPALLAPESGRDVCYIDTPFLLSTEGTEVMLEHFQRLMLKNNGVPHWGKWNTCLDGRPDLIEKFYPRLNTWREALRFFNPSGTFDNHFVQRLQLRGR